jgi:Flp pilus assembly protein CpaB
VAALAGFVAVSALSPRAAGGAGVPTVVMVHDVAAGHVVGTDDVEVVPRPGGQRPVTALSRSDDLVGRVAAGPLNAGEVVVPGRLVGSGLLAGQPSDHVAMSVPVLDVEAIGVRPGSRVDLYATGAGSLAASDVVVLGVRDGSDGSGLGRATPPQVTVALSPSSATEVARSLGALEAGQIFTVAIRNTANRSQ